MRIPSQPGQTILGDRGENLSSVLAAICADGSKKKTVLAWIRKLTPMDVDDLVFDAYSAGRILLSLKEKDGRIVSAESASDGTLRFLAVLAAIFGPEPASFYFIEELENGIHPTRLGLSSISSSIRPSGGAFRLWRLAIRRSSYSSYPRNPWSTRRWFTGFPINRRRGSSRSSTSPTPVGSSRSNLCGYCMHRVGSKTL